MTWLKGLLEVTCKNLPISPSPYLVYLKIGWLAVSFVHILMKVLSCTYVGFCEEGNVRLVVGDNAEDFYQGDYSENYDDFYYDKNGLVRGRVEVCVGGEYGTVCNNSWDYEDASVVCVQLGLSPYGKLGLYLSSVKYFLPHILFLHFETRICSYIYNVTLWIIGAINMSASDFFSEGISPGLLTNIRCSGSETELLQCTHNTSRGVSCDPAGIICQGTFVI